MVIDFHSHNFPASLAARAIEVMCGKLAAMNEQMGGNFRPVVHRMCLYPWPKKVPCF